MFEIGDRVKCSVGAGFPESVYEGTVKQFEQVTETDRDGTQTIKKTGRFGVALDNVPFQLKQELHYFWGDDMILIEPKEEFIYNTHGSHASR